MAADPQFRSLRLWESSSPCPPPETATEHTDPRIAETEAGLAMMNEMFPLMQTMHHEEATTPTECQDLLGMSFRTVHFDGFGRVPSYLAWVTDCDMRGTYRYHRRVLRLLQWHCPPRLWHLKTPVHMFALDALIDAYPDAKFLWSHRDPAKVLGSVCSLIHYVRSWGSDRDDAAELGAEQLDRWWEAVSRAMDFRARVGDDRFADLSFADLQVDPVGALGRGLRADRCRVPGRIPRRRDQLGDEPRARRARARTPTTWPTSGSTPTRCASGSRPTSIRTMPAREQTIGRDQGRLRGMDLGIADATAVVTGGSKGMGRAVAEVLAGEGARVAVMARGREALDDTVAALRAAGSPDAVGISVDMTDADSIGEGFAEVAKRWGSLNMLVHTIGPGAGRFEQLDDSGWDEAFALGTMSAVRSVRGGAPADAGGRLGAHGLLLGPLHSAPEPDPRRLHRVQGGGDEHRQEPGQVAGTRRHPGEHRVPGLHRDRQLHREPAGHLRRRGPRPRPTRTTSWPGSTRRSTSRPTSAGPACPTRWPP